jgi:hypothetical protein
VLLCTVDGFRMKKTGIILCLGFYLSWQEGWPLPWCIPIIIMGGILLATGIQQSA